MGFLDSVNDCLATGLFASRSVCLRQQNGLRRMRWVEGICGVRIGAVLIHDGCSHREERCHAWTPWIILVVG
jgi:hypothetical protein